MSRIYLSPPDVGTSERELLLDAFDSNWIAPIGPHIDAFEREVAAAAGVRHAVALSSGTAALHLALVALDIPRDRDVITSTMTFAATANAITYVGARPAFVDVTPDTWTMDADLLDAELALRARYGNQAAAVISVDLYGQCCAYDRVERVCRKHGVPLVEDAAEALGATYRGTPAGAFGECGVFSFNGNKIITTSGGGMLVSNRRDIVERARHLATQAREPAPHYEHAVVGYNYRLSNLLAALGRAQLRSLPDKIARRRRINERYREALSGMPGIAFLSEAPCGTSNCWLTCITVASGEFDATAEDIRKALEAKDIESRPLWKPMHLQPVYRDQPMCGGAVAERLFATGLCLPSGSTLTESAQASVVDTIAAVRARGARVARSSAHV